MARPGTFPNAVITAAIAIPIAGSLLWSHFMPAETGQPPFVAEPLWLDLLVRVGPLVALLGVGWSLVTMRRDSEARTLFNSAVAIVGTIAAGIMGYAAWFIRVN